MGPSKVMRSVQILSACVLFMASATSECAGEESCAVEKDSAALLQSNVQVHGIESASGQASAKVQDGSSCSAETDEEKCAAEADCSWTGDKKCAKACHKFDTASECPDYCFWIDKGGDSNSHNYAVRCRNMIPRVDIGHIKNRWRNGDTLVRPGFITRERLVAATDEWEACGAEGDLATATDCWVGIKEQKSGNWLDLQDAKYTSAAMNVGIDCEFGGDVDMKLYLGKAQKQDGTIDTKVRMTNAAFKIWYNLKEIVPADCCDKWKAGVNWRDRAECACSYEDKSDHQCQNCPYLFYVLRTNSNDEYPVLRVETSRASASAGPAQAELGITILNVGRAFDECMQLKSGHAQCMKEFTGAPVLRSSHQDQLDCLDGHDTSFTGCVAWRSCLSDEAKSMIEKVNRALLKKARAGKGKGSSHRRRRRRRRRRGLIQVPTQTQLAQQRLNASASPLRGTCISPDTIDPEEWDCKCFDWIYSMADDDALHAEVCADAHVCSDWKETHCDQALLQNAMTVHSKQATDSEGTMTVRSEQTKDSEDVASLDESLSGKRC